jgi:hypothetical protein
MLKLVLHDWQDEPASIILRNCRAALDRGGKLLVMEHLRTSDDLCFWDILDVAMMAIQRGRERTEAEYAALLQSAAFSVTQVRRASPVGMSVIEAVAA